MESPILIIGGTRGIGRALAEQLIAHGRPVITVGRTADAAVGVQAHWQRDILSDGLPQQLLPEALGGLAYCPGSIDLRPLRSFKADDLRAAFELNAVGAFTAIQACADRLKRCPGAGVVLFSTVAVQRGMAYHASVAAAKGAVEGLTRSLAAELAPAVRVNCI
ncbi:MAG: SDR family NAD(P)-dependent oxidoreductase, partial [Flavobacteriales bacterium]